VTSVLTRGALVAIALLAGAWLVLSVRALDLQSDGRAVLARARAGAVAADDVRRGQELFARARRFNADTSPLLDEASLRSAAGRGREGIAAAERLVEEEPDNVDGWIVVYLGSRALGHRTRAAEALRRLRALNPLADQLLRRLRPTG
jgi:hypothetical protein